MASKALLAIGFLSVIFALFCFSPEIHFEAEQVGPRMKFEAYIGASEAYDRRCDLTEPNFAFHNRAELEHVEKKMEWYSSCYILACRVLQLLMFTAISFISSAPNLIPDLDKWVPDPSEENIKKMVTTGLDDLSMRQCPKDNSIRLGNLVPNVGKGEKYLEVWKRLTEAEDRPDLTHSMANLARAVAKSVPSKGRHREARFDPEYALKKLALVRHKVAGIDMPYGYDVASLIFRGQALGLSYSLLRKSIKVLRLNRFPHWTECMKISGRLEILGPIVSMGIRILFTFRKQDEFLRGSGRRLPKLVALVNVFIYAPVLLLYPLWLLLIFLFVIVSLLLDTFVWRVKFKGLKSLRSYFQFSSGHFMTLSILIWFMDRLSRTITEDTHVCSNAIIQLFRQSVPVSHKSHTTFRPFMIFATVGSMIWGSPILQELIAACMISVAILVLLRVFKSTIRRNCSNIEWLQDVLHLFTPAHALRSWWLRPNFDVKLKRAFGKLYDTHRKEHLIHEFQKEEATCRFCRPSVTHKNGAAQKGEAIAKWSEFGLVQWENLQKEMVDRARTSTVRWVCLVAHVLYYSERPGGWRGAVALLCGCGGETESSFHIAGHSFARKSQAALQGSRESLGGSVEDIRRPKAPRHSNASIGTRSSCSSYDSDLEFELEMAEIDNRRRTAMLR